MTPLLPIASRVQLLIDMRNEGSVKDAATNIGLTPSTLLRIAKGQTHQPTLDVLTKIASYYGVPIAWLLTGDGESPTADQLAWAAQYAKWSMLVQELNLGDEGARLIEYPRRLLRVYHEVTLKTTGRGAKKSDGYLARESRKFEAAIRREYEACIQFFEEWIDQSGVAAVRNAVLRRPDIFDLGVKNRSPVKS